MSYRASMSLSAARKACPRSLSSSSSRLALSAGKDKISQVNCRNYSDGIFPASTQAGQGSSNETNKARTHFFGRYDRPEPPKHLMTLADLSTSQIQHLLEKALTAKHIVSTFGPSKLHKALDRYTVALMFTKRSTRTRVASESALTLLGGHPMFLGAADSQLGVNETLQDTAKVVGSMVEGFMARVDAHEDVEELAKYSPIPVINALSDLYHPTQILADLMTLQEVYAPLTIPDFAKHRYSNTKLFLKDNMDLTKTLSGKKAAWVGDTNNISNELLVTLPRFGMDFAIASPEGYNKVDKRVWDRVVEAGTEGKVTLTTSPAEALKDADIVITDTWISMGQEEEKASRLKAFSGYQITNELVNSSGAKPDWKFLHCLPRKQEEVDDEVFYGPRSVVFPEAENRKWTILACFDQFIGRWSI